MYRGTHAAVRRAIQNTRPAGRHASHTRRLSSSITATSRRSAMPASLLTTRLGADGIPTAYVLAGVVLAWLVFRTFSAKNLRRIPTEGGPSLPIISFIGLYTFLTSGKEVLQRGYEARKGRTFKVALIDRWLVVLSGKALVEELQKMPDDTVESATAEIFEMHHVFGVDWHKDPVHLPLLRSLTRNLGVVFVDMFEEMETAFRELVPAHNDRWVPVHVSPVFSTIVTRAANRVFVGQPICRDGGYVHMMLHVAEDVTKAVALLTIMPAFLKGLIARKATVIDTRIQQCLDYLRPAIDDRMAMMARFGKEWDKPNDLLQWTIDEVTARNWTPDNIARIILFINFGAIETTSHAIIHALYDIAVRPEVAAALREEAEIAVAEAGWTKAAMTKMRKLDSFLRESQRMNGPTTVSMFRHVLRPVTLSDGTHLPAGTTVVTPTLPTHLDGANYADAGAFDALRFYRAAGVQPALVTTSADYITFGHGKHACPGRFFAANELKAALAYVLVHYDVKPEHDGVRPPNVCNGLTVVPDAHARVLFRKRQTD